MHKKKLQSKSQECSQQIINTSPAELQNNNLEQVISQAFQTLDPEHALLFLNSLEENSHTLFCYKAQLYAKLQNCNLAFDMCKKALQFPSLCIKCITLYEKLFQLFLPRKLPLLDFILQRSENNQNINPDFFLKLRKIKQSQSLDLPFQDFFTDLQLGGAEFSKISIVTENVDNRTVIARAQIQKDQTILFIPKQKLILLQSARESEIVKKIHQEKLYLRSPKHSQLAIFLLEQQQLGEKSLYWHYIKHFPKNFETFPVNYKPQQLEHLKGSPFLDQIQQKKIDLRRDYDAICSVCSQFSKYNYQNFRKHRLLVSSRIFGIVLNKIRTDALAPLADMLNHHIPKQTSWYYSDQQQGFIIKSLKPIAKGEQIYDSYGQKCNSRFLLNYGFTILDNDVNQVSIKIPFQYQEDQKVQIYRQITLKISKNLQSKEFQELLSILRHSVLQQNTSIQQWCIDTIKQTPFINLDIEAQIWQKLEKILQAQLAAYPTTLKDDRKLIGLKDLHINYYNCIVLRKGQKQILHFYLTMAKRLIKHFRGGISLKGTEQLKEYESYLKQLNFS